MKKFPFLLVLVIFFIACDKESVNEEINNGENTIILEDNDNDNDGINDDIIIIGDTNV